MRFNFIVGLITLLLVISIPTMTMGEETSDVLVKLKGDVSAFASPIRSGEQNRAMAALRAAFLRKQKVNDFTNTHKILSDTVFSHVFFGFYASLTSDQISVIEKDPMVAYITEAEEVLYFDQMRDDHLPFLEFPQTPFYTFSDSGIGRRPERFKGKGVHVYVFDSGMDNTHMDIAANLGEGFASASCDHPRFCPVPYSDRNGHGTHVSGLVAALDNTIDIEGVAPEATLHPVKVCSDGGGCSSIAILQGIEWAVADMLKRGQPAVGNASFGGRSDLPPGRCLETGYEGTDPMAEAFCNASLQGMVMVTSAGNFGKDAAEYFPAKYDSVITVSAFDSNQFSMSKIKYPKFSNYGTGLNPWTQKNSGVITISAPGVDILSLNRTHGDIKMSGTSMASPIVAGAVALVLEAIPQKMDLSALKNVRQILVDNAEYYALSVTSDTPDVIHEEGSLNITFLDQLP